MKGLYIRHGFKQWANREV